ncbi:phenylalanyl-tRNA synthetase beta subunit [Cenarchaeum symbiosum A]|uniref:phenylalanine--tRNA ligase n=1 Tax=Cenarchaeum symbiosum (strain A) TaxID=414004 RepID=A0RTQ5_CENSY|nr:phenylalanyl-tRNA synthetase beta subunit [Cenarchaeum symbiosum A]
MHDINSIAFPLRYTTAGRGHRFVPLHSDAELTVDEILEKTEVGTKYGPLLKGSKKVPVILDAKGRTVSFPPVINAARTTVNTKTLGLFVDVTGTDKRVIEDVLSVIALTLQGAGFTLYSVRVSGAGNSTPLFRPRKMRLDAQLVNSTLGLDLKPTAIVNALRKSRLDAIAKGKIIECTIPRHRFDILGEMDLVEDAALGYGMDKLGPRLPTSSTLGMAHPIQVMLQSARGIMTGLGYTEILNSSLTSKRILYENTDRDPSKMISVSDSKSLEHTILRDSLLPGVIDSLAANIHHEYPQRLFEIGTVFGRGSPVSEQGSLCAASSHGSAGFTEIKSTLQSAARHILGGTCKTRPAPHDIFEEGHSAEVLVGGKVIGIAGELSGTVRERFRLREPVSAFEIKLPG